MLKREKYAISFCLGKFEFLGTEEEAREKAKAQAIQDLLAWEGGEITFDELIGYTRVERINPKTVARGRSPAIAVKR